jgi:hypothetical protein
VDHGHRHRRRLVAALAALAALGLAQAARAQDFDDDIVDDDRPQQPPQAQFFVADQNFDQFVFGNVRTLNGGRDRLESLLSIQIDEIDRACRLSPAQRAKLRLAGRGDIKRFDDLIAEKRKEWQVARTDQFKFNDFIQKAQPLRMTYTTGLFGDSSFFAKVVKTTLGPSQAAALDAAQGERRTFRHQAMVDRVVSMLDNVAGLTSGQRRRLTTVLREKTRPARKTSPYEYQVILYQAGKLPEGVLRPIFTAAQWERVDRQLSLQSRNLEQILTRYGLLDEKDADEDDSK